jgi:hypothetical protein
VKSSYGDGALAKMQNKQYDNAEIWSFQARKVKHNLRENHQV